MTEPTGKEYRLVTIADIYTQLSAEQIPMCLAEMATGLVELKAMDASVMTVLKELQKSGMGDIKLPSQALGLKDGFIWIDDGKTDHTITIDVLGETMILTNKPDGESQ